jgi:D-glycerate 3-kinase
MQDDHDQIAAQIAAWQTVHNGTLTVGISGSQGSGKTTLTRALATALTEQHNLRVVQFSLDDLYKTKAERTVMAQEVHPLFATRTLPGTHDIALGLEVFKSLKHGRQTAIPFFDKAVDDRTAQTAWTVFDGQPDVILFEGWCLGARPAANAEELAEPLNDFERQKDPDGAWRRAIDLYLRRDYPALWNEIDRLVFIKIPSFDSVFHWRKQQESETFSHAPAQAMSDDEIRLFTGQAERITRRNLETLPAQADMTLHIAEDHALIKITRN